MTVSTTSNKIIYDGDNSNTSWAFTFPGVAAADILVYITDSDGDITQISSNLYSVTLNPAISPNPTSIGGTVVYPLTGSPLATGNTITIIRTLPLTQGTSLNNQGTLLQSVIESTLDYETMTVQQLNELLGRQLTVPVSDPTPGELPSATARANLLLGFDSDGDPTAVASGSSATVSAAMIPVVGAATLAAARTAMGLGSIATESIGAGLADDGAGAVRSVWPTVAVSTNQAVVASFHLKQYIATGPINFTFPAADTLFNGFGLWIYSFSGAITLVVDAGDQISGTSGAGVSYIIPAGTGVFISTDGAATGNWYPRLITIPRPVGQCQLTKSGANLLLSPYNGANLFINGTIFQVPAAGITLAPTALAAATLYYIYAYMNGSTMTLEASATAYAVNTAWGNKNKTGDTSRSLVGMARTSAGVAWIDTASQRWVRSWFNDPGINVLASFSTSRSTASTTVVELNSEIRNEFLCWTGETVRVQSNGTMTNSTSGILNTTQIGFNSTTPEDTIAQGQNPGIAQQTPFSLELYKTGLTEGYNYATLLGFVAANTGTWLGGASGARTTLRVYARMNPGA